MTLNASNMTYRKDIDGLRALAVLLVIFNHAEAFALSGGYVGVDVFFVISGYLISQRIIYSDIRAGFSYQEFYIRRIRRLFPAMFSTIGISLFAGLLVFRPVELKALAVTATSSILSVANVQFFLQSGYWESESRELPLLHIWSLSVEEQFYVFWPLLLLIIIRRARSHAFMILAILAVLSVITTTLMTELNRTAAFYLTPFRVYEFALGAMCVWFDGLKWEKVRFHRMIRVLLFLSGIALIIMSSILFDSTTPFPGFYALAPAVGTALIILANLSTGLGYVFSNPPTRYLGLISYSLYLVHWPVFVFARQFTGQESISVTLALIALIFILSAVQYHFVEVPFRQSSKPSRDPARFAKTCLAAAIGALFIVTASNVFVANNGFPQRFGSEFDNIVNLSIKMVNRERALSRLQLCGPSDEILLCGTIDKNKSNILVIGDSHAEDGLNAVQVMAPGANLLTSRTNGCPLLTDVTGVGHSFRNCQEWNKQRFAAIDAILPELSAIVFSQRIKEDRMAPMMDTISYFADSGVQMIVLGAGPEFKRPLVPLLVSFGTLDGIDGQLQNFLLPALTSVEENLEKHLAAVGGIYISKRDVFCPENRCKAIMSDGSPMMYDTHHLTYSAARELGRHFRRKYPRILQ